MAQVEPLALPSRLFMTPFDQPMGESEDIKRDSSSWNLPLSSLVPKFTPSDWFNPSPDPLTSDYFAAPLSSQNLELDAQLQNPLNGALAPSFWLFQNPSESPTGSTPTSGSSGNGSNSSLPSPFPANAQPTGDFNYTQAGPSTYATSLYDRPNAIPTSLLVSPPKPKSSPLVTTPVLPSTTMAIDSPEPYDEYKLQPTITRSSGRGAKRRGSSISSIEEDGDHEDTYEIHEGVERDGMIWGMKVEDYRALSARERKRVRNRISARTFRAKRKEHLSSLETDLNAKDAKIKSAQDEAAKLRKQVAELKKRLAKYEVV